MNSNTALAAFAMLLAASGSLSAGYGPQIQLATPKPGDTAISGKVILTPGPKPNAVFLVRKHKDGVEEDLGMATVNQGTGAFRLPLMRHEPLAAGDKVYALPPDDKWDALPAIRQIEKGAATVIHFADAVQNAQPDVPITIRLKPKMRTEAAGLQDTTIVKGKVLPNDNGSSYRSSTYKLAPT